MKFNRNIIVCLLAIVCEAISDLPRPPSRSLLFFPHLFAVPKPAASNKPFSIFSRPHHTNEKDDEPHKGQAEGGIISHVGNVLHGGSIGIEIRPLAPLQGILDHAKKFIPGRGTVGRPNHEKPGHEPINPHYERPSRPNKDRPHDEGPDHEQPNHPHYERPDRPNNEKPHNEESDSHGRPPQYERPHQQRPGYPRPGYQRPGYQRPNVDHPKPPKKEDNNDEAEWETHKKDPQPGPQWEDIGEVPSTEEEEYGEGVLQPRRRPKRFVESKIYHVPLLFRSNGRADRVRIKGRNGIWEKTRDS